MKLRTLSLLIMLLPAAGTCVAQTPLPDHLVGNLGAAIYATRGPANRPHEAPLVLPFAYADYERLFARVDTVGFKTLPIGVGYLELVGRISVEGSKSDRSVPRELRGRANPVLLGVGTYQETAIGGFFLYALHDLRSGGNLLEATYAAEFSLQGWKLYPQLGVERRSSRYEQRVRGVTQQEAETSGRMAYAPGASTTPVAGLAVDIPLGGPWFLNLQWRRQWFGGTIRTSPRAGSRNQDSGFAALSYAFN